MKIVNITLPIEQNTIQIVPLFDMHIGAGKCNLEILKEKINYIHANDNCYTVLGGDSIDNAIPDSVASVACYEQPSPTEQINLAVKMLEPIKDKILFGCCGNHEERTMKKTGIDIMQNIMVRLNQAERYDATAGLIFLTFGKAPHATHGKRTLSGQWSGTIYCTHGCGGGMTIGAKANKAGRVGDIIDSDIALVGHTHQLLAFPQSRYSIDRTHHTVNKVDQLVVNCDSTLGYERYAERSSYRPSSDRWPIITWEVGRLPRVTI